MLVAMCSARSFTLGSTGVEQRGIRTRVGGTIAPKLPSTTRGYRMVRVAGTLPEFVDTTLGEAEPLGTSGQRATFC